MRKLFAVSVLVIFISLAAFADQSVISDIMVSNGSITPLPPVELALFGEVDGTVLITLGNHSWSPDELWLVQPQTTPDIYRSISKQLELPASLNLTATCKTSVYYNTTLEHYAFKVSSFTSNGSFCILAYAGTYDLYAKV